MNKLKRLLGIALSLVLALSCCPIGAYAAESTVISGTNSSIETNVTTDNALKARVNSEENIVYGYQNKDAYEEGTVRLSGLDPVSNTEKWKDDGKMKEITDGNLEETVDIHGTLFTDEKGKPVDGRFIKLTFRFLKPADIEQLLVLSTTGTAQLITNEYEVYASNDIDKLYDAENLIETYKNTNGSRGQLITFNKAIKAQYLGIKVTKGVDTVAIQDPALNWTWPHTYCRFREIAVFGKSNLTESEKAISVSVNQQTISELKSDGNLLYNDYESDGLKDEKKKACIEGRSNGKLTGIGYAKQDTALFDGNPDVHTDIQAPGSSSKILCFVKNVNGKLQYDDTVSYDITINLMESATFNKIFVASPKTPSLRAAAYKIYWSSDLDTLYDNANLKYDFDNEKAMQYQTFKLKSEATAKYIGIRFTKGVVSEYLNSGYGESLAYLRLSEIAVFGKYNTDYYNYSVTSGFDNSIIGSGNVYSGKQMTFEAPLVKDNKSFSGWNVNGAIDTENAKKDTLNGKTTLNIAVDKELNIVAEYIDTPSALVGGFAKNYNDKFNKLIVPQGTAVCELLNGFDNYPETLEVVDADGNVQNSTTLVTNKMKLNTKNSSGILKTFDIAISGDADGSGSVTVNDVVKSVDAVIKGSKSLSEEEMLFTDLNGDGKVTVSDVSILGYKVFETSEILESYAEQYVKAEDMQYKYMGRKVTTDKFSDSKGVARESVFLEMTGTGIEFNVNACGDVAIDISKPSNDAIYMTVVVDGVESEIILPAGYTGAREFTVARNLSRGIHKIGLYRQGEGGSYENVFGVRLNGAVVDAPENSEYLIDFVGDSITCGEGNLNRKGTKMAGRHMNGYYAYSTITARTLGYDYGIISKGGSALVSVEGMANTHMPTEYLKTTYNKDWNLQYDFQRKADIVVVNLGTNDAGLLSRKGYTTESAKALFKKSAEDFAATILEKNGNDTKIVFAFGMMGGQKYMFEAYTEVAEELNAQGHSAYFVELPKNLDGGSSHPSLQGDIDAAAVLSEFIKTTVMK